jgi:hypothetical protein
MDPTLVCELDESVGHVLATLVILELLHFRLEVVLCKRLVGLESQKCVAFSFELHSSPVGGCIINEGHPIAIAFSRSDWERAMQIRVNELKRLRCA